MSPASSPAGGDPGRIDHPLSHGELRSELGAYVLGQLDAAGRHLVEEHLASCGACRQELAKLAALPAVLRRVLGPGSADTLAGDSSAAPATSAAPSTSEPSKPPSRVVALARQRVARRRRARIAVATAMLVMAAAAGASGLRAWSANTAATARAAGTAPSDVRHLQLAAVEPSAAAPAGPAPSGTATLTNRAWGAQVVVQVTHVPKASTYDCVVIGPHGAQVAGSWLGTPTGTAVIAVAVAMHPRAVSAVEVVNGNGTVILASSTPAPRVPSANHSRPDVRPASRESSSL